MKTENNILTLDKFKDKYYSKRGSARREKLKKGYKNFKELLN